MYWGWANMTRNKYCDVCGTEWVRGRRRKQKSKPSLKKKKLSTKKKTVISLLTVFVILGVSVPVSVNYLVLKPQYDGRLKISSANIIPIDSEKEQLQLLLRVDYVDYNIVSVKKLELFSLARDKLYVSLPITFELEKNEVQFVHFVLDKNDPLFTEGFCLKVRHKYKVQWITFTF